MGRGVRERRLGRSTVLRLVGRPDLAEQPWFSTGSGRAAHVDEIDEAVASWIRKRDRDDVLKAFEAAEAAIAPVYDARDILAIPNWMRSERS